MEDEPPVNALAIASFILGLAAVLMILIGTFIQGAAMVLCIPALAFGPIAAIVGSVASRQIRRSEGSQQGSELALAGQILGVVSLLLILPAWVYIALNDGFCCL